MTKSLRKIEYLVFTLTIAILVIAGCGGDTLTREKVVQQLTGSTFSFTDQNEAKGTVSGSINLDASAELNKSVNQWVVYWSDSDSERGKSVQVCAAKVTNGTICEISNEKIQGTHLILYATNQEGAEFYTDMTVSITDTVKEEPPKVEKTPKAEEPPKVEETPKAEEPTKTEVPKVEEPVEKVETPTVETPPVVATPTVTETPTPTEEPVKAEEPQTVEPVKAEEPATIEEPIVTKAPDPEPVLPEPSTTVFKPLIIMVENILYDFDRAEIKDEYMNYLDETFGGVEDKDAVTFIIAGHADERGSNEYNLALGERRAYAVKRYIISLGFPEENVKIVSYGEEKPLDAGHGESAWSKNRRAVTEVVQ